jgi:hypothetical protein
MRVDRGNQREAPMLDAFFGLLDLVVMLCAAYDSRDGS